MARRSERLRSRPPKIEIELTRFIGAGPASAIAATCLFAIAGSSAASAQVATISATPIAQAAIKPLLAPAPAASVTTPATAINASLPTVTTATPAVSSAPVTAEGLWPLIWANMAGAPLDEELNCIATAVYFESRGEPFDGQLAVAEVVMNRARSGRYPSSYCGVVKQPAQFSFVRRGQFPRVNTDSPAWSYAQAITRIAANRLADAVPDDVLWYHADYVAPGWGRRLSRVEKIGAHIFYRA